MSNLIIYLFFLSLFQIHLLLYYLMKLEKYQFHQILPAPSYPMRLPKLKQSFQWNTGSIIKLG